MKKMNDSFKQFAFADAHRLKPLKGKPLAAFIKAYTAAEEGRSTVLQGLRSLNHGMGKLFVQLHDSGMDTKLFFEYVQTNWKIHPGTATDQMHIARAWATVEDVPAELNTRVKMWQAAVKIGRQPGGWITSKGQSQIKLPQATLIGTARFLEKLDNVNLNLPDAIEVTKNQELARLLHALADRATELAKVVERRGPALLEAAG